MRIVASPNFNARTQQAKIKYVILHYTGMETMQAALERMCTSTSEVSAHYMIDEDGSLIKLVDEALRAWHAGESFWKGETDLNSLSIGIELVNLGHQFGYRPFPAAQIAALKCLLKRLFQTYHLGPDALLAHSDVAPARKEDPGELFPWQDLAKDGFGVWPETQSADENEPTENLFDLLAQLGYDTTNKPAAWTAFQRRYCPEELNTIKSSKTIARLKALASL